MTMRKRIAACLLCLALLLGTTIARAEDVLRSGAPRALSAAEGKLLNGWESVLSAANRFYGSVAWALDYLDAWTDSAAWGDLVKARTAVLLISDYLEALEFTAPEFTQAELVELARAGYPTSLLEDMYVMDMSREKMWQLFRQHVYPRLDADAIFAYQLDNIRDLAFILREMLLTDCESYALETNYLLLPLLGQDGGEALTRLEAAYPHIFNGKYAWESDAAVLEGLNDALQARVLSPDNMVAAWSRCVAREENAGIDLELGIPAKVLTIANMPVMLPVPLWHDAEYTVYLPYGFDAEGGVAYPDVGDALSESTCCMITLQMVDTLAEVEAYIGAIEQSGVTVRPDSGGGWIVLAGDYSVGLTWEDGVLQTIFLRESCTFTYTSALE